MTSLKQDGLSGDHRGPLPHADVALRFRRQPRGLQVTSSKPVEILDSKVVNGDELKGTPDLIQFSIRGVFQMAGIDSTPKAPVKEGKRG